jgi:hypothetical protein
LSAVPRVSSNVRADFARATHGIAGSNSLLPF